MSSREGLLAPTRNMLGATHEAKDLEFLEQRHPHRQPHHGRGVLEALTSTVEAEEVSVTLRRRPARGASTARRFADPVALFLRS